MKNQKCCIHLTNETDESYFRYFTGNNKEYYLICSKCALNLNELAFSIIEVDENIFNKIESDIWECGGIIGKPNILIRDTDLFFEDEYFNFRKQIDSDIIYFTTENITNTNIILALTNKGEIWKIDYQHDYCENIYTIPADSNLYLSQEISIRISNNGKIISVVNSYGQYGIVVDIEKRKLLMRLDRGDYHFSSSLFPNKFFEYQDQQLLIHGTNWNRLDISNPQTSQNLTQRNIEKKLLDYFHADISISENNEFIIDNGWIWHPFGEIKVWNLQKWLKENCYESEIGETLKSICSRIYYWGGKICWINNRTIAIYGFGEDAEWIIPAVRIFDVIDLKEIDWFPGPDNNLTFDKYLFSTSKESGTKIWDINTGEMLLNEKSLKYDEYNKKSKIFYTLIENNTFKISKLIDSNFK
jgi:hypothetical protein